MLHCVIITRLFILVASCTSMLKTKKRPRLPVWREAVNRTWFGCAPTKHRRALHLAGSTDREVAIASPSQRRSM